MNRFKFKIITLLISSTSNCYSAENITTDPCLLIEKTKNATAILTTENGKLITGHVDLGKIDSTNGQRDEDYILSKNKFRIIIHPKKFTLRDDANQAFFISQIKIKPICKNTNEILLSIGVRDRPGRSGKFEIEKLLSIDDPEALYENQTKINFKFINTAVGEY